MGVTTPLVKSPPECSEQCLCANTLVDIFVIETRRVAISLDIFSHILVVELRVVGRCLESNPCFFGSSYQQSRVGFRRCIVLFLIVWILLVGILYVGIGSEDCSPNNTLMYCMIFMIFMIVGCCWFGIARVEENAR